MKEYYLILIFAAIALLACVTLVIIYPVPKYTHRYTDDLIYEYDPRIQGCYAFSKSSHHFNLVPCPPDIMEPK